VRGETMTDTTKFASPVNDVKPDAQQTIEEVGDSMRRRPSRWGTAGAGLLAAVAAVGVLAWRRQRKPRTPREKVERVWRDAKSRAAGAKSKVGSTLGR